jgi:hypothetical protein
MAAGRRIGASTIARGISLALAAVMIYYFVFSNPVRADNPFLVPDAILTLLLLGAPLFRGRFAGPAMIFAFAWAAGVWTVSLCTYAVRGEFAEGANHLVLIAACLIGAGVLVAARPAPARVHA